MSKQRGSAGMADFLSLPSSIVGTICAFCSANEVLALSLTCQSLHQDIETSMVSIHCKRLNIPSLWNIPIFFSEECHSVFITWQVRSLGRRPGQHTLTLEYRWKQQRDPRVPNTVIWTRRFIPQKHETVYISFRNDPTQEYFLRCENDSSEGHCCVGSLRKQYMVKELTPAMTNTLNACMQMGCVTKNIWKPITKNIWKPINDHLGGRKDIFPFFMKLFVLCFESLSNAEPPSHIHKFFDESFASWNRVPSLVSSPGSSRIGHIPKQVCNIFEQALEQKEPADCGKRALSSEEVLVPPGRWGMNLWDMEYFELPDLLLRREFVWTQSHKRPHWDQESEGLGGNGLEFVARIPLTPNTRKISLSALSKDWATNSQHIFVLFFQKRDAENLEQPIDGNVVLPRHDFEMRDCDVFFSFTSLEVDVDSEYESCFLYYVPYNNATKKMKLGNLTVTLAITRDSNDNHERLFQALQQVLGEDSISRGPGRTLPLQLLHVVAKTLVGGDQQEYRELKDALDLKQLDTTPSGLERMVDVCHELLRS